MLHRAGVAVLLIATLLLPYGRCQSPGPAAGHDCCAHPSAPMAAVQASCCTIRGQLPAIVGHRAALGAPPLAAVAFVVTTEPMFQAKACPLTPAAHHSPPPGASILRI